jgi:hypothetical protein
MPKTWVTPHEGLDHDVAHGSDVLRQIGQLNPGAVRAFLHRERGNGVGKVPGWNSRERVVVVAVPRAPQQALLDRALAQRATLVRAAVLQRAQTSATPGEGHRTTIDDGSPDSPLVRDVDVLEAMPGVGCRGRLW